MQTGAMVKADFKVYALSESAVTVAFGNEIGKAILQQVSRLNEALHRQPFPGFQTTVPAYATLTVFFDPWQVAQSADLPDGDCFEKVSAYLHTLKNPAHQAKQSIADTITIPVCYGGGYGPDINDVAALHNITVDEVIRMHSEALYEVYMIGFVPGFAYLGGMSEQLAMPRKATPRNIIPAGSVGIAGGQTGIYPLETPGGWQLIGRTPFKMFDSGKVRPSLLKAGDTVIFMPVDEQEFNRLAGVACG